VANLGYIQLLRQCNQRCLFCSNPDNERLLELSAAKEQVDDLTLRGYDGVILTGGEPTLSPIVAEVTRYAVSRGLHVRLISNGSRLGEPGEVAALVAAGLRHFHLSIHSLRPAVQDFLTGTSGSHSRLLRALECLGESGAVVDINTVINRYNAHHLDETVALLLERFGFVRHVVWNNLDPSMGRVAERRDTIPMLRDFEVSLHRAMRMLDASHRTFRVERVPLCYMTAYAHCSTETRKIVKGEERLVNFLDAKGVVRQTDFRHGKFESCRICAVEPICAGLFDAGNGYDPAELFPVFVDRQAIVARVHAP